MTRDVVFVDWDWVDESARTNATVRRSAQSRASAALEFRLSGSTARRLRQRGSKMLGGRVSPARSRAISRPPWIDGRNPTPLQPRL